MWYWTKMLFLIFAGAVGVWLLYELITFPSMSRLRNENPTTTSMIEYRISEAAAEGREPRKFMIWTPTVSSAFSLYLRIVLGMGLIFQMPVVIFVLARFGIVTWKFLAKNFKYAVLIIFIVAAVASPGQDPASQLLFAAPMIVLYGISIGVAWLFGKKKPAETGEI